MRGEMSGRRRRAREGAHPSVRNRARAGGDTPLAGPAPNMQVRLGGFGLRSEQLPPDPGDGVVVAAGHPLLERDDGVVGDPDVLGADVLAALGDVAHAKARLAGQQRRAVGRVFGGRLQPGHPHHVARPVVGGLLVVVAQDVADVLAEEALDALAELEHPLHILGSHPAGAWIQWMASRTTIPSCTGTWKGCSLPVLIESPRNTSSVVSLMRSSAGPCR